MGAAQSEPNAESQALRLREVGGVGKDVGSSGLEIAPTMAVIFSTTLSKHCAYVKGELQFRRMLATFGAQLGDAFLEGPSDPIPQLLQQIGEVVFQHVNPESVQHASNLMQTGGQCNVCQRRLII